jgi:hypothetical protein
LDLTGDQLASYIATGALPESALAQLQNSTVNGTGPSATEEEDYKKRGQRTLRRMSNYEKKLRTARKQAEAKNALVSKMEKKLSDKFVPAVDKLNGRIRQKADEAARAAAQTLVERRTRMHYKQTGALDHTATYWMEVADKEREARRIAEAQLERYSDWLTESEAQHIIDDHKTEKDKKADEEAWFRRWWSQLNSSQKIDFQSNARKFGQRIRKDFGEARRSDASSVPVY